MMLVLAFTACTNEYGQLVDDSAQTRALSNEANSEKFEFGKMYAINKLPTDVYNYIPKDTVWKYINSMHFHGDSISITPIHDEQEEFINQEILFRQSAIGNFSLTLDTHQEANRSFSLILSCTVYEGNKAAVLMKIDPTLIASGILYIKNPKQSAPRGVAEITYKEGIPETVFYCEFTAEGKVYERSRSTTYSYNLFVCEYRYAGIACSRGVGYSNIRGGIID